MSEAFVSGGGGGKIQTGTFNVNQEAQVVLDLDFEPQRIYIAVATTHNIGSGAPFILAAVFDQVAGKNFTELLNSVGAQILTRGGLSYSTSTGELAITETGYFTGTYHWIALEE